MSHDALLLLSFGGPERREDVIPFLENVTRGRGVPRQRLEEVAEHYYSFGGRSPINSLNRHLIADIETELATAGIDLPVYFGNRNWKPLVENTVQRMGRDGVRSALVFPTSAWGGYSGCLQYHEDIARARAAAGPDAPRLTKIRQYYDHPLFIAACSDAVLNARAELPPNLRGSARLVFTAHSIPVAADKRAGPPSGGGSLYSRQVRAAARLCAAAAGFPDHDVVWQSRSGPPQVPWLAPDIMTHLEELADTGTKAVIVCPIGFVSDHLEVRYDLDREAAAWADETGMAYARAATPGADRRFARMVVELTQEHLTGLAPRRLGTETALGCTDNGLPCVLGCCGA